MSLIRRVVAGFRGIARIERDRRVIRASGLFDAGWYRAQNPDVVRARMDPVRHYLRHGWTEGRDPAPGFSVRGYLRIHPDVAAAGAEPLGHYLARGRGEGRGVVTVAEQALAAAAPAEVVAEGNPFLVPLRLFAVPAGPRVNLLTTDDLRPGGIFGGSATALIAGALLARRTGATLRVIGRTVPPDRSAIVALLHLHAVPLPDRIETEIALAQPGAPLLPAGPDERWLATSWWTAHVLRDLLGGEPFTWIIQEDERSFHPAGDDWLRCTEMLADPGIRFLVNTPRLQAALVAAGFPGVAERGHAFLPAFPRAIYPRTPRDPGGPWRLLFYARPGHPRNLYLRGLAVLDAAIEAGVLEPADWRIGFVGTVTAPVALARGVRPELHAGLDWAAYGRLVGATDVGLSLMASPHPSYPPLDLAAAGAVVVTNRFAGKDDLADLSPRILCADPDVPALVAALARAATLARQPIPADPAPGLPGDWTASLGPAIDGLLARG
ncbi:MAG: hypothetical protein ACKOTZ_10535 [Chloroflexota bacterium]